MADKLERSWYTKYRPRTLEEYSGPQIKNIISKRFTERSNYPHTLFVQGPRGTGKTTICRLLSKFYLCEHPNPDGTPCEHCETCEAINETLISGEGIDVETPGVVEVDATIENGKQGVQDIIDDAIQPPIYTTYKIIIFDECHELSRSAQNSLLKVLEDIPDHLVCMFCTTNPEKVLQTIKSRMQLTLEAKRQTVQDMAARLMFIANKEGLTVSQEALEIISKKGDRVPRECINILEGVAKTYGGEVTVENVQRHLGDISSDLYMKYFEAANTSLGDILSFINTLKQKDIQYKDFVNGLVQFVLDSLYVKHGIALDEYPTDFVKSVKRLFSMYESSEFSMLLDIIEELSRQAYNSSDTKMELLLTTTALRIGKVSLLANGLSSELSEGLAENKRSLYEHSQKLKQGRALSPEKLMIDLDLENIADEFEGTKVVTDSAGMLDNIELPELKPLEEDEEENKEAEASAQLDSAVEGFFE